MVEHDHNQLRKRNQASNSRKHMKLLQNANWSSDDDEFLKNEMVGNTFISKDKQGNFICKKFIQGLCEESNCKFSHKTDNYPCQYMVATGQCGNMETCVFSHRRMQTSKEIREFMEDNYAFLDNAFRVNGSVKLGSFFTLYQKERMKKDPKLNQPPSVVQQTSKVIPKEEEQFNNYRLAQQLGLPQPNLLPVNAQQIYNEGNFNSVNVNAIIQPIQPIQYYQNGSTNPYQMILQPPHQQQQQAFTTNSIVPPPIQQAYMHDNYQMQQSHQQFQQHALYQPQQNSSMQIMHPQSIYHQQQIVPLPFPQQQLNSGQQFQNYQNIQQQIQSPQIPQAQRQMNPLVYFPHQNTLPVNENQLISTSLNNNIIPQLLAGPVYCAQQQQAIIQHQIPNQKQALHQNDIKDILQNDNILLSKQDITLIKTPPPNLIIQMQQKPLQKPPETQQSIQQPPVQVDKIAQYKDALKNINQWKEKADQTPVKGIVEETKVVAQTEEVIYSQEDKLWQMFNKSKQKAPQTVQEKEASESQTRIAAKDQNQSINQNQILMPFNINQNGQQKSDEVVPVVGKIGKTKKNKELLKIIQDAMQRKDMEKVKKVISQIQQGQVHANNNNNNQPQKESKDINVQQQSQTETKLPVLTEKQKEESLKGKIQSLGILNFNRNKKPVQQSVETSKNIQNESIQQNDTESDMIVPDSPNQQTHFTNLLKQMFKK